jgi:hypothetical protein
VLALCCYGNRGGNPCPPPQTIHPSSRARSTLVRRRLGVDATDPACARPGATWDPVEHYWTVPSPADGEPLAPCSVAEIASGDCTYAEHVVTADMATLARAILLLRDEVAPLAAQVS